MTLKPESHLPDSVDPAPRVLRLLAAAIGKPDADTLDIRLMRMADILEGAVMPIAERKEGRKWVQAAVRERRVTPVRKKKVIDPVVTKRGRILISDEDLKARQQLIEAGIIGKDD